MFEQKIGNMYVGQEGYVVPWGILRDSNGDYWINTKYTIFHNQFGTSTIKISRTMYGYEAVESKQYPYDDWVLCSGNVNNNYSPLEKLTFRNEQEYKRVTQAKVPTYMITSKLYDVPVGSTVHVEHEAIWIDQNNNVWIDVNSKFSSVKYAIYGAFEVTIKEDGYYVTARLVDAPFKWSMMSTCGGRNVMLKPVKSLVFV